MRQITLSTAEAIDLLHAWIQNLADSHAIRVIFIKGPSLHRLGLRGERVSTDVDVLIEPAKFDEFCTLLEDDGWTERAAAVLGKTGLHHAYSVRKNGWPCDIDVHSYFPGFLAKPPVVFEALWQHRSQLDFAHRPCTILDRPAAALILALHSLRSLDIARQTRDYDQLIHSDFTRVELAQMVELARQTESTASLVKFFEDLDLPSEMFSPSVISNHTDEHRLREWRMQTEAGRGLGAYYGFHRFWVAPWRKKPAILRLTLWPSNTDLQNIYPELPTDSMNAFRQQRLWKGIGELPALAKALWKTRVSCKRH